MEFSEKSPTFENQPDIQFHLQAGVTSSTDIPSDNWEKAIDSYSELATEIVDLEAELNRRLESPEQSSFVPYVQDQLQNLYDILYLLQVPQQNPHYELGGATVADIQPGTPLLTVTRPGGAPEERIFPQVTTLTAGSPVTYEQDGSLVSFASEPGSVTTHYEEETPYEPSLHPLSHYPSDMGIMPRENGFWIDWNITIVDTMENRINLLHWLQDHQEDEAASIVEKLIYIDAK